MESNPFELEQARIVLREQVQNQNLPVPISANPRTPVELHVVFHFPTSATREDNNNNNNNNLDTRGMLDVARELTIGILYTDNESVAAKSVRQALRAIDGDDPVGCIRIKFRLLSPFASIADIVPLELLT